MTVEKLRGLEKIVYDVLLTRKNTRNNDFLLIRDVYYKFGVNTKMASFDIILSRATECKLPPFESITRARRKLQRNFPELLDEDVAKLREQQQQIYIDYVLGD